jgi:hypothetical protein
VRVAGFVGEYPRWCRVWRLTDDEYEDLDEMRREGLSYREIADHFRLEGVAISKSSIGRYFQWQQSR